MASEIVAAGLRDVALRGVIEILLQPEYGDRWIIEDVLRELPADEITDDLVEQVDGLIMAELRSLAKALVPKLSVDKREGLEYLSE